MAATLIPCPRCFGTGQDIFADSFGAVHRNRTPSCDVCSGFGAVCPESVCECGRTALHSEENLLFCGRTSCFKAKRTRLGLNP